MFSFRINKYTADKKNICFQSLTKCRKLLNIKSVRNKTWKAITTNQLYKGDQQMRRKICV